MKQRLSSVGLDTNIWRPRLDKGLLVNFTVPVSRFYLFLGLRDGGRRADVHRFLPRLWRTVKQWHSQAAAQLTNRTTGHRQDRPREAGPPSYPALQTTPTGVPFFRRNETKA
eukprot:1178981-Prorocentrum_minimum.AAC.2